MGMLGSFSTGGAPRLCVTRRECSRDSEQKDIFKVEADGGRALEQERQDANTGSVISPERANELVFLKRETESFGETLLVAEQQITVRKKWSGEKKVRQRWLMICGRFSWQRCVLCGGKLLCMCMFAKTEKWSFLKLQQKHQYDC